jgi:hypothetical protein
MAPSSFVYAKACIYFDGNGYFLEFVPKNRLGFPPEELYKLNAYAKKRNGVLFVKVHDTAGRAEDDDAEALPAVATARLAAQRRAVASA